MKMSRTSSGSTVPHRVFIAAIALSALNLVSASAHAGDPKDVRVITLFVPAGKIIGRDAATGALIQERRVMVRVQFDPDTLATNSGVAVLKDSVIEAAQKACDSTLTEDTVNCVYDTINTAQSDLDAAIARARNANNKL
jgi:hypothetical protein